MLNIKFFNHESHFKIDLMDFAWVYLMLGFGVITKNIVGEHGFITKVWNVDYPNDTDQVY